MSIWLGNQRLDNPDTPRSGYNVGDIFYTTRMDEALAGAVECNGGTYSTADYTGAGSIGELLRAGKLPYLSLAEYATYLTTHNGNCGVFGWDGGTEFRVPLLKDIFIEATRASDNQLGWNMSAGLPSFSATFDVCNTNGGTSASGDITLTNYHSGAYGGGGGRSNSEATATLTPKNPIYGNSDTVQPEAIKYRAMIQLFNSATDEAVATVGTVVAQVGELRNMSNVTATGKETVFNWGMPDYTAGIQVTTTTQTAPKNGWIIGYVAFSGSNVNCDVLIDNKVIGRYGWTTTGNWFSASVQVPIKAGQTFRVSSNGTIQDNKMYFYPNNE